MKTTPAAFPTAFENSVTAASALPLIHLATLAATHATVCPAVRSLLAEGLELTASSLIIAIAPNVSV
jgi:hypothetical protein